MQACRGCISQCSSLIVTPNDLETSVKQIYSRDWEMEGSEKDMKIFGAK